MKTENTQEEISVEESAASLGLSTRLSEQLLMSIASQQEAGETGEETPEGSQTPETPPTTQEEPEVEEEPQEEKSAQIEGKMDEKLEILRTEMKDTMKVEMDSLREMIKEALNETE